MSAVADRYAQLARITAARRPGGTRRAPCRDWTARDVVAHVINGHGGILFVYGSPPAAADGVGVSSMSGAPVVAPGTDLAAAFIRDDLLTVLRAPDLAARRLPTGRRP